MQELLTSIFVGGVFGSLVSIFGQGMKNIKKKNEEDINLRIIREYNPDLMSALENINLSCTEKHTQLLFKEIHRVLVKLLLIQKYMMKLPHNSKNWLKQAILYHAKGNIVQSKLKISIVQSQKVSEQQHSELTEKIDIVQKTIDDCLHNIQLDSHILLERSLGSHEKR